MKIVTAVVNNPTFIEVQYHTLKKYVKGDYDFIVFNDAKDWPDFTNFNDSTVRTQIRQKCSDLGITCIDIPNKHHKESNLSYSQKSGESCNYMMSYMKSNPDKYFVIDSDMFLINTLDIKDYEKFQCAIVLQERYRMFYPWNGLFYIDVQKDDHFDLINWSPTKDGNLECDTGGASRTWLSKISNDNHPKFEGFNETETIRYSPYEYRIKHIYYIKHLWSLTWNETEFPSNLDQKYIKILKEDPRNRNGKFYCEIYDNKFLHIRGGGRWDKGPQDLYNTMTQLSLKLLSD
jgi:hypothetical protein